MNFFADAFAFILDPRIGRVRTASLSASPTTWPTPGWPSRSRSSSRFHSASRSGTPVAGGRS